MGQVKRISPPIIIPLVNFDAKNPPKRIRLGGIVFQLSAGLSHGRKVIAHYREDVSRNSMHAVILAKGARYEARIGHRDSYNPHYHPLWHWLEDVI